MSMNFKYWYGQVQKEYTSYRNRENDLLNSISKEYNLIYDDMRLGLERIMMDLYELDNIREVYKNDLKTLQKLKMWVR